MKPVPKIGSIGELTFVVEERHAIDFAENGMPAVLSTPWLIWFLEHSAREAILSLLEPGETTVGVQVEVQHLAATPLGHKVTCRSRVIGVDGSLISFQLEAHDERERVARGMHKLRVVQIDRLAKRVAAKMKIAASDKTN